MEATVKAAQIDPRRADNTLTPGAKSSVLLVEQALAGQAASWTRSGSTATSAPRRSTPTRHSSGRSATPASTRTGCPGKTSLTTLGAGPLHRHERHRPGSQDRPRRRHHHQHPHAGHARRGRSVCSAARSSLSQGSYNPGGDPTSAGTHDGGGVVDVSVDGMTAATRTRSPRALRAGRLRRLDPQPQPGRLAVAHPRRRDQRHRPVHPGPEPGRRLLPRHERARQPRPGRRTEGHRSTPGRSTSACDHGRPTSSRQPSTRQTQRSTRNDDAQTHPHRGGGHAGARAYRCCSPPSRPARPRATASATAASSATTTTAAKPGRSPTSPARSATTAPPSRAATTSRAPAPARAPCIKNNAASVWNRSSKTVRVYFNTGYARRVPGLRRRAPRATSTPR